jgi:hypothetical protein
MRVVAVVAAALLATLLVTGAAAGAAAGTARAAGEVAHAAGEVARAAGEGARAAGEVARAPVEAGYDVVVVGSEPEAIAAAVAAAETGARTALVTEAGRLGGLFVTGAMNVLDLRMTPVPYQRGLFERWWERVGRGNAFDTARAEGAFTALLEEAGVSVRLGAGSIAPLVEDGTVLGVLVDGERLAARHVIDGTADADVAAAAGARSTIGWESLGVSARMVDTLVFRIDGIDWSALRWGARVRGRAYAYVDDRIAYGHFGGHPAAFRAETAGVRLRGLNLGRQDDGTVLVNALLIYGIDPFDPDSRAEGRARAAVEVPRVVAWLAQDVPGFEHARVGALAETLYVRETRHLDARCVLTVDDVMDHVVTDLDIAAGGYPLDVQTLRPSDDGFVFGAPEVYGARLCMTVPRGVEGLWVVGRSAGFDPIAHASARVVPFGMTVAEAVGVAASLAVAEDRLPQAVAEDRAFVQAVRSELLDRGAYLAPVLPRTPAGPLGHAHYDAFREMLRWGLAVGGYDNDPRLDAPVSRTSLLYLLANVFSRAYADAASGPALISRFGLADGPLAPDTAAEVVAHALCLLGRCPEDASWSGLSGAATTGSRPDGTLTRGDIYALATLLVADRRPDIAATLDRR